MSLQGFNAGPLTYKAGATPIPSNTLVTLTSTEGVVALNMYGGVPVGIADGDIAANAYGNFMPLRGRVQLIAADAIAPGDYIMADDDGLVNSDGAAAETDYAGYDGFSGYSAYSGYSGNTTHTTRCIGIAETGAAQGAPVWVVCPR